LVVPSSEPILLPERGSSAREYELLNGDADDRRRGSWGRLRDGVGVAERRGINVAFGDAVAVGVETAVGTNCFFDTNPSICACGDEGTEPNFR